MATRSRVGSFTIGRWNETENTDWNGGKLTRTLATKDFKGEIEGTAVLEAVMLKMEGTQGVMAYVGVEHISCTLDGRTGTFVLVHNAEAIGPERNATWKILPGSGTGESHRHLRPWQDRAEPRVHAHLRVALGQRVIGH